MTSPFDPPTQEVEVEQARASLLRWALVVGTWGLSFAAVGTAAGVTAQLGGWSGAAQGLASLGLLVGVGLGALVLWIERLGARQRPEVVGANGVAERPLHGAVLLVPLCLVAAPGLSWLAGAAALVVQSPLPALGFGTGVLGALWAAHRVWAQHRLARGLEAYQVGEGTGGLAQVATSRWVTRPVRDGARINLALVALQEGRGEEALRWLDAPWRGSAAAWAAAGRALALLLVESRVDDAEEALREALVLPGRSAVDAELDAVRVLIVWRQHGPDAARDIAEQLYGPGAGVLHRALLGRLQGGPEGERLLEAPAVRSLLRSGLGRAIPELGAMG